jgi:uncharacterized C2H2 Zn-finger protein
MLTYISLYRLFFVICVICELELEDLNSYQEHVVRIHSYLKCPISNCTYVLKDESEKRKHLQKKHPEHGTYYSLSTFSDIYDDKIRTANIIFLFF